MDFNKIWNSLSNGGKIVGIAGIVLIINIFLPWYGFSAGGFSSSINAFDAGFLAWGGSVFAIAGAVFVLIGEVGESKVNLGGLQGPQIGLLLAGLGAVLVVLRFLTETDLTKFGLFIGILASIAVAVGGYMSVKESGIGLPTADDFKSIGGGDDDAPPPPPPA
jgi:hypothetical protein